MKTILIDPLFSRSFVMLIFFVMSLTTFASDTANKNEAEYIEDRDVMDAIKSIVDPEPIPKNPGQVRIYNMDLELIRIGDEDLEAVKQLLSKSDFIMEMGDLKIYRLNR